MKKIRCIEHLVINVLAEGICNVLLLKRYLTLLIPAGFIKAANVLATVSPLRIKSLALSERSGGMVRFCAFALHSNNPVVNL
jgi:hypothetical protein